MSTGDREKQIAEAEEILGEQLEKIGLVKGLFFGQYLGSRLPPYPSVGAAPASGALVDRLRAFCHEQIDPVAIDRNAEIPQTVIDGLGKLGVLGACLPKSCGGLEMSQTAYCELLEVLGGHCASTALFVNAHHSIGPRALVLFGTPEQQSRWLPKLASGEWLSAFALTEPEAGSDAANVQSTAVPSADAAGYLLNGQKQWITNGGIAQVLTVMARTPVGRQGESKITAFIVTPEMAGFEVVEKRMEKCGVRGTATARLAFHDMFVPRENVLGTVGKGLRVALTVLDFGRTTFGASCTGAAKFCARQAALHAQKRVQFGRPLSSFELVKQKLAYMHAGVFAMEACTYQTAALIDSGVGDFMLETAMLKVFATEMLWTIVNDTFQIHGGRAYFCDEPYERIMRDARINTIGEGANDVLRAFTALVGMREVGLELKAVLDGILHPPANLNTLARFVSRKLGSLTGPPVIEVRHAELENDAYQLARAVRELGRNTERLLRTYREDIVDRQYELGRVADVATELYVSTCVLRRLDSLIHDVSLSEKRRRASLEVGRYFLATARRRMRRALRELWDNEDAQTTRIADLLVSETAEPSGTR